MSLLDQVFAAGVVGAGGAGFPTHRKLTGPAQWLIVNGVECEPLLASDRHVMRHHGDQVVAGARAVAQALGARALIATKRTYGRELAALTAAIAAQPGEVELRPVDSFYPAGDEQTLIFELTGRTTPPGGLPAALGVVVVNVTTARNIALAMAGQPVTRRLVTVNGAVARPAVVDAPVGALAADLVAAAGGATAADPVLVRGGPLMGRYLPWSEADRLGLGKADGGLLVLPGQHRLALQAARPVEQLLRQAQSACVQCQACTDLCPRYLIGHQIRPHLVMRATFAGGGVDPGLTDPLLCCECGLCELFACPMGLSPRRIIQYAKGTLRAAGARPEPLVHPEQQAERPGRRVPQSRLIARLDLERYPNQVDRLVVLEPDRVVVPLRHGVGRAAEPVVEAGQAVALGQVIAQVGLDEIGCLVHASIAGRVAQVGAAGIVIEREGTTP
ncbi:MAG: 4Fe-4S dicluster domain-containing protein [Propionibacteriaceae bacterium]|nr:4Fe-4S dicluster domain-containing protein [Propionibacteriaceae bacterium]